MERKLRVGVIFGGRSGEHEVSLMSSRSVLNVLNPEKYEVTQIGITLEGVWVTGEEVWEALHSGQVENLTPAVLLPYPGETVLYALRNGTLEPVTTLDVVFPVLHGTFGEDGTLQGLLEMADCAYVGAGVLGSAVGMDKGLFKDVMRAHGLPVTDCVLVTRKDLEQHLSEVIARVEELGNYPFFTKPANLGSSVGITKCHSRSELYEGLLEAARYDRRILIERGVPDAREIEVSVLGNEDPIASVPGEIVPGDEFYSYEAKYLMETSKLLIPAPLSESMTETIRQLAVQAYRAIDCAGMARVDFLVNRSTGDCFINEINTIPGFTAISMYPKLWEASGIPYEALIDRLIDLALERKAERDRTQRHYRRGE